MACGSISLAVCWIFSYFEDLFIEAPNLLKNTVGFLILLWIFWGLFNKVLLLFAWVFFGGAWFYFAIWRWNFLPAPFSFFTPLLNFFILPRLGRTKGGKNWGKGFFLGLLQNCLFLPRGLETHLGKNTFLKILYLGFYHFFNF